MLTEEAGLLDLAQQPRVTKPDEFSADCVIENRVPKVARLKLSFFKKKTTHVFQSIKINI